MRWEGGRESENVEDRRGMRGRPVAVGGLGMLLILVLAMLFGFDPRALLGPGGPLQGGGPPAAGQQAPDAAPPQDDPQTAELKRFVAVVLGMTEDVWTQQFAAMGRTYRAPTLVLYDGQVQSACGIAGAAVGPFYCPADEHLYLDMSFFQQLQQELRAPGEFAQAYVIAHEIGHHVQNLLGIFDRVNQARGRMSEADYNQFSVRLELQADFLAGMWAHHAHEGRNILERGDIESALVAAQAIGDDRLMKRSRGYVVPDSFTHGSSAQRMRWFRRGLESGKLSDGDTFNTDDL